MKRSKVKPQYDLSSSDNMHSEREQHKDEVTLQLDLHTSSDNKLRNRMKVQHCDKHLSPYTIEASTRKKNTIKMLKIDDSISSNPFRLWAHKCASLIPKLDFYRIEEDDSLHDGYKFTLKFPNEKGICNIDAARGKFISVDTLLFDFEKPRKWCFAEKIEVTLTKDGCQNACNLLWNDDTIGVWVPNEPHTPHHYFNSEETIEPPFRTGFYQSHEGSTRHSFEVLVRDEDENTVGTLEVGCISKGCDFRLEDGSFVYMAWYEKSWEYTFHEGSRKIMQHFIMNKDGSISPERAPWLVIAETAEGDLTLHNPSKIADKNDKTSALLVNHASDVYSEFVENDTRVQITPKIAPNLSTSWDKDGDEKWNLQPYEEFNRPTIVNVKVGLYSLTDLDTKSKTARIDLGVWCYWFDPRMASRFRGQNENSHVVPPGLWAPYFSLSESLGSNEMSIEVEEFEEVCQKFPGAAPGKMYTFTRYRGIIRNVMELQAFPYDFDPLEMTLFAQNNITFSNRKPERLSTKIDWRPLVMVESNFCIPQEADDFEVTATSLKYVSTRRQDGIQFVVHLSRFGQRKILNIILPLGLITVLDLYAFLVIDAELQARLMHHTTLFLAVVALLYVVRGQMPEKNRNTSVDTAIQVRSQSVLFELLVTAFITTHQQSTANGVFL